MNPACNSLDQVATGRFCDRWFPGSHDMHAPAALILLASAEPKSARFLAPLVAVVLFSTVASTGQGRRVPTGPFVVLVVLLGFWLFGVGLVWSDRWPSMVRSQSEWVNDTGAWEWDALLALGFVVVALAAASVRAFVQDRRARSLSLAGLALAGFAGWTAVVRYSVALALVLGGVAFCALVCPWHAVRTVNEDHVPVTSAGATGASRGLTVAGLTVVGMLWVSFALLLFLFREGENTVCHCWADNRDAWQYTAQLLIAVGGVAGLGATGAALLRRRRHRARAAGLLTVGTLLVWIAFMAH